ncbi:type I restriction enzyme endonuclease domain-containing protein, partial [Candidatus Alkanophaga liquidiphilum]
AADVIEALIEIAKEIKKKQKEGEELNLTEEELAFYDLLSSKEKVFENYEEIKAVAKEIVKELGYHVKLADWNKKEYLRAKIKVALKNALIKVVDARISYGEINKIASEILTYAEEIYGYMH